MNSTDNPEAVTETTETVTETTEVVTETTEVVVSPPNEENLSDLTVGEIAAKKLLKFKIAYIGWTQDNKNVAAYFVPVNAATKPYNKRTNSFKLKTYLNNQVHVIPASNLLQISVITEEDVIENKEGASFFLKYTEDQKQNYTKLVETYNFSENSENIYTKEGLYATLYQLSVDELQDLDKCKEFVMNTVSVSIDKEIEKLRNEFTTINSDVAAEPTTAESSDELEQIVEFLTTVKQDYSIFEGAESYETILKSWPTIIQPSPFSLFQNYVDRYHSSYIMNDNQNNGE